MAPPYRTLLLAVLITPLDSFYHPVCRRAPSARHAQQQQRQRFQKREHKRREPEREPERRSWDAAAIKLNRQIANREGTHKDIFRLFKSRRSDFSEVNYATALNWLAKKQPRGGYAVESQDSLNLAELLLAATERLDANPDGWDARALANAAWGAAKLLQPRRYANPGQRRGQSNEVEEALKAACASLLRKIGDLAEQRPDDFKAQELANVAWSFATADLDAPRLYASLATSATPRLAQFSAQELANVAWAFSKRLGTGAAGLPMSSSADDVTCAQASKAMFEAWSAECILRFPDGDFKAQELANAVWAVATSGFEAPDAFWDGAARAAAPILQDPQQAQTQNIANCVWSYAKAGDGTPAVRKELFEALAAASSKRVDEFNAQELGNLAWAYATANEEAPDLFDAIAQSAEGRVERFIPQNLANTAWAFATASHKAPRLLNAVAREAARRADDFKTQELANTAWAFATCSRDDTIDAQLQRQLFDNIARASYRQLDRFSDQGLSNLAWAFSAAGEALRHEKLFGAIATESAQRVTELKPQGFSNLAWAFATAEYSSTELFSAMAQEISRRPGRFNPQEIANTAWAFAKNAEGEGNRELFDTLATATLALGAKSGGDLTKAGFTPQELSNLAWAYACADHVDGALLQKLWNAIVVVAAKDATQRFTLEELRQLQQVVLHARTAGRGTNMDGLVADVARAPAGFTGLLRRSLADAEASPSRAQEEVADSLEALGLEVVHELVIPDGLSVDVALKPLRWRVAVEFDGPRHYFRNEKRLPTGRTNFKVRLLRALGWRVLHVPYFDWARLPDEAARQTYLKTGLADIVKSAKQAASVPTGAPPAAGAVEVGDDRDEFDTLKVAELRRLCADRAVDSRVKRGLDARATLIERLRAQKRGAGGE